MLHRRHHAHMIRSGVGWEVVTPMPPKKPSEVQSLQSCTAPVSAWPCLRLALSPNAHRTASLAFPAGESLIASVPSNAMMHRQRVLGAIGELVSDIALPPEDAGADGERKATRSRRHVTAPRATRTRLVSALSRALLGETWGDPMRFNMYAKTIRLISNRAAAFMTTKRTKEGKRASSNFNSLQQARQGLSTAPMGPNQHRGLRCVRRSRRRFSVFPPGRTPRVNRDGLHQWAHPRRLHDPCTIRITVAPHTTPSSCPTYRSAGRPPSVGTLRP